MFTLTALSLIDIAYKHVIDAWVVFRDVDPSQAILRRWLKPGFGHVEVWQYVPPGAWLRINTAAERIGIEVYAEPPWRLVPPEANPTILHIAVGSPHGRIREPFFVGPLTCVQMAAAILGVRLPFWCRTPYSFYKLLRKQYATK